MVPTKTLVAIVGILFAVFGLSLVYERLSGSAPVFAEASTIGQGNPTFDDILTRFRELAKEKGAEYSFDVLRVAELPPNTDIHLVAHEIGHELYVQQGIEGMAVCTHEFRNGCSHSLVVETMQELGDGDAVRALIDDACKKAPGGSSAYGMCYHGLGHGVLSFYGFTFPKTVEFCMKTATEERNRIQSGECIGGAIMELVAGGGHDRERWTAANKEYFSPTDPLAPCSTSVIPESEKSRCYVYMSPHLMEYAGATFQNFTMEQLGRAMEACTALPFGKDRSACVGGFGKDFPHIANDRDVRQLDMGIFSDEQLQYVEQMCLQLKDIRDVYACETYALSTFFWGGDAEPSLSRRFCAGIDDAAARDYCFRDLAISIFKFVPERERSARCDALDTALKDRCMGGI